MNAIMPHSTHAYAFELKVLNFAGTLSAKLSAGRRDRGFLMILNNDGSVRLLQFEHLEHSLVRRFEEAGESYLFFDPF
ncbi:MAG TPA: hypothetical protein VGJ66_21410, partial [Pyrinomonadaceae bacterium]